MTPAEIGPSKAVEELVSRVQRGDCILFLGAGAHAPPPADSLERQCGQHPQGQAGAVRTLAFDSSGRFLFTSSADGSVRRWSLRLDELRDLACRMAGRNLTRDEWSQNLGNEAYRPTCPDFPAM